MLTKWLRNWRDFSATISIFTSLPLLTKKMPTSKQQILVIAVQQEFLMFPL